MISRDARHVALPQVGERGQQQIAAGRVLLIGVGGIGCSAATYLASAGIGQLHLCDFDTIDASNLSRQPLYTDTDIGLAKVDVASARLSSVGPNVDIKVSRERLSGDALNAAVSNADVVLDGSDNFATRFEVNDACVRSSTLLVTGAAIRLEGQLAVFGADYRTSPCYRCLYTAADESLDSCEGNGVLAPIPAIIGNLMAVEALKSLVGLPSPIGKLHLYDALASDFRTLTVSKREDCPICSVNSAS